MRYGFYPWERLTTEPANRMPLVRCKRPMSPFSHRRAATERAAPRRAKATHALPLPLKRCGLRRATAPFGSEERFVLLALPILRRRIRPVVAHAGVARVALAVDGARRDGRLDGAV